MKGIHFVQSRPTASTEKVSQPTDPGAASVELKKFAGQVALHAAMAEVVRIKQSTAAGLCTYCHSRKSTPASTNNRCALCDDK